jgi:hypothetical protein
MNKRSAMLVAAGLVLTLVVGGVAVAVGLTGPEASSAQPKLTQHKKNKPIIKTTKKTVTVHKKAEGQAGTVVTVPAASTGTASSSSGSAYDDSTSSGGSGTSYGDDSSPSDEPSESEDSGSEDEPSSEPSGGGSGVEDD